MGLSYHPQIEAKQMMNRPDRAMQSLQRLRHASNDLARRCRKLRSVPCNTRARVVRRCDMGLLARSIATTLLWCVYSAVLAAGEPTLPGDRQTLQVGEGSIRTDTPGTSQVEVVRDTLVDSVPGAGATVAPIGAHAVDMLTLADGRRVVLGTVDDDQGTHAALWRLRSDGSLDTAFATTGLLVALGEHESEGLSLQQSADGMLHIAVLTGRKGEAWLEVHRWLASTAVPLRIARQSVPKDWIGPASLIRRKADWVWLDKSRPQAPPLDLVTGIRDSPWTAVAAKSPLRPTAMSSDLAHPPVEETLAVGHAILNPLTGEGTRANAPPTLTHGHGAWTASILVAALIATLGGVVWWLRRS
jgi:hypothetical protein